MTGEHTNYVYFILNLLPSLETVAALCWANVIESVTRWAGIWLKQHHRHRTTIIIIIIMAHINLIGRALVTVAAAVDRVAVHELNSMRGIRDALRVFLALVATTTKKTMMMQRIYNMAAKRSEGRICRLTVAMLEKKFVMLRFHLTPNHRHIRIKLIKHRYKEHIPGTGTAYSQRSRSTAQLGVHFNCDSNVFSSFALM